MDGLLCNPSVLFSNRREAEKGCREQCSLLRYGAKPHHSPLDGLHRNPSLSPLFKPPRSEERVQGTMFPAGVWGDAPSLPLDGLHRNPSLSHLLQTAAKRRWESEGQSSLRRGLGRQPHHSPPSPRPRPRHSMRTFRPSIIAARALRENASNCLSVMCSIRLSGFTEPAAVVLAVGTP